MSYYFPFISCLSLLTHQYKTYKHKNLLNLIIYIYISLYFKPISGYFFSLYASGIVGSNSSLFGLVRTFCPQLRPSANPLKLAKAISRSFIPHKKPPDKSPTVFYQRTTRLELATSTLGRLHSTTELHPQDIYKFTINAKNYQVFFINTLFISIEK